MRRARSGTAATRSSTAARRTIRTCTTGGGAASTAPLSTALPAVRPGDVLLAKCGKHKFFPALVSHVGSDGQQVQVVPHGDEVASDDFMQQLREFSAPFRYDEGSVVHKSF